MPWKLEMTPLCLSSASDTRTSWTPNFLQWKRAAFNGVERIGYLINWRLGILVLWYLSDNSNRYIGSIASHGVCADNYVWTVCQSWWSSLAKVGICPFSEAASLALPSFRWSWKPRSLAKEKIQIEIMRLSHPRNWRGDGFLGIGVSVAVMSGWSLGEV